MKHVLIIDDDEDIRFIIKMILEKSGNYSVHEAVNAASGLTFLENQSVDILLLDYLLPDAKGLDLLSELDDKKLLVGTQVVALTARKDAALEKEFLGAGARAVFHKPFDPGQFLNSLEAILEPR